LKRILHLTGSFLSGGSERQAASLAVVLKGTFDVHLATLNLAGPLLEDVRGAGFDTIPEFPLTSFYNANFVKQVRACARYLRDNRIDLIHTHDFYTNVFGMAAGSLAGTKAKITSKRETGGMRSRAQDVVERIAFGRADKIVTNAQAVAASLLDRGVLAEKMETIHNGIELERFTGASDIREKYGIDSNSRMITLVANLRHHVKNVPMFLAAAKTVADHVPDVHFVIAGEGELLTELQNIAAEFKIIDRTHFIGRCDDIPSLLVSSYACVLTSKAEGFANAIVEYMAAGKPVVATNVGGASEAIVDGETGFLVASQDADAMAHRLVDLLNDKEMAAAFGKRGKERAAAMFSREAQLKKTIALYDSLLS
jgi:glycosyltransferase involved in cell wall biosynthesis